MKIDDAIKKAGLATGQRFAFRPGADEDGANPADVFISIPKALPYTSVPPTGPDLGRGS